MSVGVNANLAVLFLITMSETGMVMDWREMAGIPTVHGLGADNRRGWSVFRGAYSGGRRVGNGAVFDPWQNGAHDSSFWDGRTDPSRGWVIAFCWLVACLAE